jgi:hypothetical protein
LAVQALGFDGDQGHKPILRELAEWSDQFSLESQQSHFFYDWEITCA